VGTVAIAAGLAKTFVLSESLRLRIDVYEPVVLQKSRVAESGAGKHPA